MEEKPVFLKILIIIILKVYKLLKINETKSAVVVNVFIRCLWFVNVAQEAELFRQQPGIIIWIVTATPVAVEVGLLQRARGPGPIVHFQRLEAETSLILPFLSFYQGEQQQQQHAS